MAERVRAEWKIRKDRYGRWRVYRRPFNRYIFYASRASWKEAMNWIEKKAKREEEYDSDWDL